ncbi:DUF4221 family protein [Belliella aquatica]|uniref:DUF4221 domain-containing protein n=1 Tax=Belliella aquatica TaxID=1323734 RepID=A0ABQ1LN32_9BACT|nr:DUF4221 family protein [Belliella aquatica]MCH7404198.1 DUF4221 domain-containing protein [Belliella aquatica]GGC26086.1 hypothetical protein GCM10010993_01480 [Belliella aquatica]
MKNLIPILFLLFTIISCQNDKPNSYLVYDDYLKGQVSLSLDDSTSLDFFFINTYSDSAKNFFLSLNPITNSVDKYSLESGELVKRIDVPIDGPEGITGILQGFTYHNSDSIFLFIKGKVSGGIIINDEGKFIDRLRHRDVQSEARTLINHATNGSNPTVKINDELYFMRYPLFDTYNPSNINDQYPLSLSYDLAKKELEFDSLITYPTFYQNEIWSIFDLTFSRTFNEKKQTVISWPLLDYLLIYDLQNGKVSKKPAKSNLDKEVPRPYTGAPKGDQADKTTLSALRYRAIIYDPWKSLYYRVAVLPLSDVDGKQYFPNSYEQEFSILTLDQDFNLLKEVFFPGKVYNHFNISVSKKGLLLMKNNQFDQTLKEDSLRIDIFDLSI